ncbi:MAG: SgcJ/EcaC family oxidoreductase [Hyphomonadaceae bacterium]
MTDAIVEAGLARWAEAFAAADFEGIANLYTEDTLFYGSAPPLLRGPSGVLGYFKALPASDGAKVVFENIVAQRLSDTVISIAMIAAFSARSWGENKTVRMRFTHVWVRVGDEWKIASHHASPANA